MMTKQKEIIVYAVSMILKAAFLAATWAGKARKRGLELIAKMPIDEKDKEIVFLRHQIYQLETQITKCFALYKSKHVVRFFKNRSTLHRANSVTI